MTGEAIFDSLLTRQHGVGFSVTLTSFKEIGSCRRILVPLQSIRSLLILLLSIVLAFLAATLDEVFLLLDQICVAKGSCENEYNFYRLHSEIAECWSINVPTKV